MPSACNVLLGMRIKRTVKVDVKGPIMTYIRRVYGDHMATEAEESLDSLQELRNQIVGAGSSLSGIGMEPFTKYLHALRAIEIRFPVSPDSSHVNITFKWHDAFVESATCSQRNIHFEKAAVLFCVAAISSQRGIDVSRETEAGMTEATQSFTLAAGILRHLREHVTIKTEAPRSVDISGECAAMLEQLMLTQAQEVFYEAMHRKAAAPGSKLSAAALAAVAMGVSNMYGEVSALYQKPQLVKHFNREWGETSRVKAVVYWAEAHSLQARQAKARAGGEGHGLHIAHLRAAAAHLKEHRRELRLASDILQRQAKELEAALEAAIEAGERDNINIYMQLVPKEVPPVAGKQMVAARDPTGVLTRSEEWFSDIVPDKVTRNLSKYTSQMEELVRSLLSQLEGATDDARLALVQHGLPSVLDALSPAARPELPEKARAALADEFVARGPAAQLHGAVQTLEGLKEQAMAGLRRCTEVLDEEVRADAGMRRAWGDAWVRPQSHVLAASLRETIARYESNMRTAGESDVRVLDRVEASRPRLDALSAESARSMMPTLEAPMVAIGAADPATVTATLRQALAALDALSGERAALEERIKTARDGDNVLPELLRSGPDGAEAVFKAHLEGYSAYQAGVDTNVTRQAELLSVIHHNMSAFRAVYDVAGWQQECDRIADAIASDVMLGNELLSQLSEGVVWYTGMQESIKTLETMCSDFAMTRTIDLEERDGELKKRQDADKVSKANEEAARRLQELDISMTGTHGAASAPRPAQRAHAQAPQPASPYPQAAPPPHATPQASPYALYPAPPPAAGWAEAPPPPQQQQSYQQPPGYGSQAPPYAAYGAPSYGAQPPPPHYSGHVQYYQPQAYPQAPYGQPPPGQPPYPPGR